MDADLSIVMQAGLYWYELPMQTNLDVTKCVCKKQDGGGGEGENSRVARCILFLKENKCVWTGFPSLSRSFRP